jgi:hypothetical protein
MIKSKTRRVFENGIPDTFLKLCMEHLPRPIHDKVEHENALEVIRALAGLDLNADQADYFEALIVRKHHQEMATRLVDKNGEATNSDPAGFGGGPSRDPKRPTERASIPILIVRVVKHRSN